MPAPDAADIEAIVLVPLYVPKTVSTIRLEDDFRDANTWFALIVDGY